MYNNRIAIVDLTKREVKTETLPEEVIKDCGGGALINQFFYDKYADFEPIIIGTGPLTGTLTPASSLVVVSAKSPLSNKLSHVPLMWQIGTEVKYSGFDFIIVTGKADNTSYLWFHDEIAEICDGTKIKGLNLKEIVDELRKELGDESIQVITIGEAGRKSSPIAMLSENYWGSKDTSGLGGVFGEKNLIACAFRGLGVFSIDDGLFHDYFMLRKELDWQNSPRINILELLKGTKAPVEFITLIDKHLHRNNGCFNCGFNCYGYIKFREDPKILKSTEIESPGTMLLSPLSLTLFYNKTKERFFELLDEAQLLGIEPGLTSLISDGELRNKEDLKKIIDETINAKNKIHEKILNSFKKLNPKIAPIYENGTIPVSLALNDAVELNESYKIISLALISGICPVFLLIKREIKTEMIERLMTKTVGIENLNQKIKMFLERSLR